MINSSVDFVNTKSRMRLLSDFWMQVAAGWFVAASLANVDLLTRIIYVAIMILTLLLALYLRK